jgi:hypothetical protein
MTTYPYRPYDLVKEVVIAIAVVASLAVLLTILFSSPDEKPSTVAQWARTQPVDFITTATTQLDGSSGTATYGPPYNHAAEGQHIGPIKLQKWLGVSHPIVTSRDFVLAPLSTVPGDPALKAALATYNAASPTQQKAWTDAFTKSLAHAKANGQAVSLPPSAAGPVPTMMQALLAQAQSGGLDGALLTSRNFYQTDYTKPLLFMADGGLLSDRAQQQHLLGSQWGMMNETGSYPGQAWLWLYTFWYQIPPFTTTWSDNADLIIWTIMMILSLALVLLPFIPGLRSIPRWIPLYKVIWRDYYRRAAGG